jgi:two-component system osmolarity sensor histidine kinase EnvZ
MKLQLAMLERSSEIIELENDIQDMQKMIEGYLAFARGEGTETPVSTDLKKLISEVVAAEKRDGSKIDFIINIPNPKKIEVRPQAIKRAVTNLISNAKRYGGKLDIELSYSNDSVTLIVDDDGPGIPFESHEDVFKAFFRLEPSRNPETGGTGLGLTIARDIARSHGGELELDTAPIGGLRAKIKIPV